MFLRWLYSLVEFFEVIVGACKSFHVLVNTSMQLFCTWREILQMALMQSILSTLSNMTLI